MKKLARTIVIITVLLLIVGANVYAATPTLDQIASSFNNSSAVKKYSKQGTALNAKSNNNNLTISITSNNNTNDIEYTLENNILSTNFTKNDAFNGLMVTKILIDSIGQLHGYSDGQLMTLLNSDKIATYTPEKEGFGITKLSDGSYQVKIDISKKIPLTERSKVFIQISDLTEDSNFKKSISGDGYAEMKRGNVWFNKDGKDGKDTLLIAEKDELTECAYKSMLSIIEVMFNTNKAAEYVKTNYSNFSIENKEFAGVKIEVNPTRGIREDSLIPTDADYKFARISIDKNAVIAAINGVTPNKENYGESSKKDNNVNNDSVNKNNNNTNNSNEDSEKTITRKDNIVHKNEGTDNKNIKVDGTQAIKKLPNTGLNMTIFIAIILISIIGIINYKKYNGIIKRK